MGEATRGYTERPRSQRGWWRARWVLPLVLFLLALVFVLENRETVTVRLLLPLVVMPQWTALTLVLIIGMAIGALLRRSRTRRR